MDRGERAIVALIVVYLTALVVCAGAVFGQAIDRQAREQAVASPAFAHGHLVDIPYLTDSEGTTYWSREYAFLAIKLDHVPQAPAAIDYTQRVSYLDSKRYDLPDGGTIARSIPTTEASEDGWIILPLSKPCTPGESYGYVGLVTVCPPRDYATDTLVFACESLTSGIAPLYRDVPEEMVWCGEGKRRAVRP